MAKYLLLRDNKQTGPHSFEEMLELGFRKYDLVWVEGKSAAWRYPGEISEFKDHAPLVEEQPYDRFFKRKVPAAAKENSADVAAPATDVVAPVAQPIQQEPQKTNFSELLKIRRVAVTMPANRKSEPQVIVPQRKEDPVVAKDIPSVDHRPEPVVAKVGETVAKPDHLPEPVVAKAQVDRLPDPIVAKVSEVTPPVDHLPKNKEVEAAREPILVQHSSYLPGAAPTPPGPTPVEEEDDDELIPLSQIPPKPFSGDYTQYLQYVGVAAALVSLLVIGILIGKGTDTTPPPAPVLVSEQPSRIAELKKKLMSSPVAEPEEPEVDYGADELGTEATAANVPARDNPVTQKKDISVRTSYKTSSPPPVAADSEKRVAVKRPPAPATERASDKTGLASKLSVSLNDYKVNMFGGIDGIEVTVKNGAAVPVTEAVVELRYILSNKNKKHLTETIRFRNLKPGETRTLPGPKSARGIKLEYQLIAAR